MNAGVTGKHGQPLRLEYSFMPLPPDEPCGVSFDFFPFTFKCLWSLAAFGRAFHIGETVSRCLEQILLFRA